jgi:hypothetical protein
LLYLLISEAENQPRAKYLKSLKRVKTPQRIGGQQMEALVVSQTKQRNSAEPLAE